jgi:hypothetical protein
MCICECLDSNGVCLVVNIFYLEKPDDKPEHGQENWNIQFSKPECLILTDNICFSCFNCCEPLVMCITYYLFTHICCTPRMHRYRGALLDFFEKCAK